MGNKKKTKTEKTVSPKERAMKDRRRARKKSMKWRTVRVGNITFGTQGQNPAEVFALSIKREDTRLQQ